MKKKIIVLFAIMMTVAGALSAKVDSYLTFSFEYSYDTNVFSDPLPQYDPKGYWMGWRAENPYLKRHSLGANAAADIYFNEDARVGISTAISVKAPLCSTSIKPVAEDPAKGFLGPWEYHTYDSSADQITSVFGSFGPVFRAQFGFADLGIALRLSMGGYDYSDGEVIMGVQAEPYFNVFFSDMGYVSLRFTYDSHLMRFINSDTKIFDEYYQMVSLAPSLGIGIKF